jgi:hypothetical protein
MDHNVMNRPGGHVRYMVCSIQRAPFNADVFINHYNLYYFFLEDLLIIQCSIIPVGSCIRPE